MPKKSIQKDNKSNLVKEEYIETDTEEQSPQQPKSKRKMTPEALERLAKAREKAWEAKRKNKELRDLEKQVKKKEQIDLKEQRKEELKKILKPAELEPPETVSKLQSEEETPEPEEPEPPVPKRRPKPKPEPEEPEPPVPKRRPKPKPEPEEETPEPPVPKRRPKPKEESESEEESLPLPRTKTVPNFDFFKPDDSPFEEIGGYLVVKKRK